MKLSIKKNILIIILIFCLCTTLIGCTRENVAVASSFREDTGGFTFFHWNLYCDYRFLGINKKKIDKAEIQLYFGRNYMDIPEKDYRRIQENDNWIDDEVSFVAVVIYFKYCAPEDIETLSRIDSIGQYNDEEDRMILVDDYKNIENTVLMKEYTREEFLSEEFKVEFKRGVLGDKIKYSHYETFTVPPVLLSQGKGYIDLSVQSIYRTSKGKYVTYGQGRRIFKYSAIDEETVKLSNVFSLSEEIKELK